MSTALKTKTRIQHKLDAQRYRYGQGGKKSKPAWMRSCARRRTRSDRSLAGSKFNKHYELDLVQPLRGYAQVPSDLLHCPTGH